MALWNIRANTHPNSCTKVYMQLSQGKHTHLITNICLLTRFPYTSIFPYTLVQKPICLSKLKKRYVPKHDIYKTCVNFTVGRAPLCTFWDRKQSRQIRCLRHETWRNRQPRTSQAIADCVALSFAWRPGDLQSDREEQVTKSYEMDLKYLVPVSIN